jgi:hypothetical protein
MSSSASSLVLFLELLHKYLSAYRTESQAKSSKILEIPCLIVGE